jgi:uncharacterized protein DUF4279
MKRPPPKPPRNAPAGTVWFGGPIPWFSMSIQIHADDLVPDEVTSLLGVAPTQIQEKGKPRVTPNGKHVRVGQFGRWSLELKPDETDEWDATEAAKILLSRVPADPTIWRSISSRARVRLSIGVSLESFNQGLSVDPALLRLLADREMQLDLEIYAGDGEDTPAADVGESRRQRGQTRRQKNLRLIGDDPPPKKSS